VHIGKIAHFRRHGIPMSDAILQNDLNRLKQLIDHFKVKQILIVGDLFHAETNVDMQTFKNWLIQFRDLKLTLIKGNHDRLSHRMLTDFNIKTEIELTINPFTFIHEPKNLGSEFITISGHIHPGVLIEGKGRQRIKLPCYLVSNKQIILPAFSVFTGLNTNFNLEQATKYAFTDTAIFSFD